MFLFEIHFTPTSNQCGSLRSAAPGALPQTPRNLFAPLWAGPKGGGPADSPARRVAVVRVAIRTSRLFGHRKSPLGGPRLRLSQREVP